MSADQLPQRNFKRSRYLNRVVLQGSDAVPQACENFDIPAVNGLKMADRA
jgi:hypothetical protein